MNKIIVLLIFCLSISVHKPPIVIAADYETTTYLLKVPEFGSRDWGVTLSNDIISIDNVLTAVSNDLATTSIKILVSRDSVATVGGAVGRARTISADGSACYILLYAAD